MTTPEEAVKIAENPKQRLVADSNGNKGCHCILDSYYSHVCNLNDKSNLRLTGGGDRMD